MPSVLSLADFDLPTRSASGFLIRWIAPRLGPTHLYGTLAREGLFKRAAVPADLLIIMGHGQPEFVTGQNESKLLRVGDYDPQEIKGKVIKLLSCQAGRVLGPDLVRNGAAAVLAYTDDYVWVMDADLVSTPWSDKIAASSLMPVVQSLNALLDGKTAREAFEIERQGYLKSMGEVDDELVRSCLKFNYDNGVLLGNPRGTVGKRPPLLLPFKFIPPPPLPPLRSTY